MSSSSKRQLRGRRVTGTNKDIVKHSLSKIDRDRANNDNVLGKNIKKRKLSDNTVESSNELIEIASTHDDDRALNDEGLTDGKCDADESNANLDRQNMCDITGNVDHPLEPEVQHELMDVEDELREDEVLELNLDKYERKMIKFQVANKNSQQRIDGIEKEVKKMHQKLDEFTREVKDLKKVLKYQSNVRPFPTTNLDEEDHFPLLPELPLTKKKHPIKMEARILREKEYKRQLIMKVSTMGGSTVKKKVIRIFKRLFSTKLRSKMCWKGTPGADGKLTFENFEGILDVLRQGVGCTEAEIETEIKLRFKQANTDYRREQEKKARSNN